MHILIHTTLDKQSFLFNNGAAVWGRYSNFAIAHFIQIPGLILYLGRDGNKWEGDLCWEIYLIHVLPIPKTQGKAQKTTAAIRR